MPFLFQRFGWNAAFVIILSETSVGSVYGVKSLETVSPCRVSSGLIVLRCDCPGILATSWAGLVFFFFLDTRCLIGVRHVRNWQRRCLILSKDLCWIPPMRHRCHYLCQLHLYSPSPHAWAIIMSMGFSRYLSVAVRIPGSLTRGCSGISVMVRTWWFSLFLTGAFYFYFFLLSICRSVCNYG